MYRVTTPTHTFTLPDNTSSYDEIQVTYKQNNVVLTKHYQDEVLPSGMTLNGKNVIIRLTQEETKAFNPRMAVLAQVRVLTGSGDAYASEIFSIDVKDVLNEEILADEG